MSRRPGRNTGHKSPVRRTLSRRSDPLTRHPTCEICLGTGWVVHGPITVCPIFPKRDPLARAEAAVTGVPEEPHTEEANKGRSPSQRVPTKGGSLTFILPFIPSH
ncbi:hypothetical protein BHM03_00046130 [Ensete ventricosum]|nr:hypothetical protein BHM03_00046130 [Ensete ventricosum]